MDSNIDLKQTVELMLSSDYKERFKAEYLQLKYRYYKLADLISKYKNGTLDFKPKCSIRLLENQLSHMWSYLGTLESRAQVEQIEL